MSKTEVIIYASGKRHRGLNFIARVTSCVAVDFVEMAVEVTLAFLPWCREGLSKLRHAENENIPQWQG